MAVVVDTGNHLRRIERAVCWEVTSGQEGSLELQDTAGDVVGRFVHWVGVWDVD